MNHSGFLPQSEYARLILQQQHHQQQMMPNLASKMLHSRIFPDANPAISSFRDPLSDIKYQSMLSQIAEQNQRILQGQEKNQLGIMGFLNGNPERVLKDDKDLSRDDSKNQLVVLSELADQSAARGDYSQAIAYYNKIIEINPNAASAWTSLGHCFSMLNDNFSALKAYQQAMNLSEGGTRDEQLWYGIGLLYEKIEDYQNAELAYKNGMAVCTSEALKGELSYHLGLILKAKTEYDDAIQLLSNALLIGKFPTNRSVEILCIIGRCFEEKNNFMEALKMYNHALSLDEGNPFTNQFLGWLFFQMDNPAEALLYLHKESLQETDVDGELNYMIARCNLALKNYNKAYEQLQICLHKKPQYSFYWSSFGILHAELGQYKSALEYFNQALKLHHGIPENYYNLGYLCELSGQITDAVDFYDKAVSIQPTFAPAIARKNSIILNMHQLNSQLITFKHPVFKLSFLKTQMKEKLDKSFINIRKCDKNQSSLLNLIQQANGSSLGMGNSNLQNQQLLLQNSALLQQQQQQQLALSKSLLSQGAGNLNYQLGQNALGLGGLGNAMLDRDLLQMQTISALQMGQMGQVGQVGSQADMLKALATSQLGSQFGSQLGNQLSAAQFGAQGGSGLQSLLNQQNLAGMLASPQITQPSQSQLLMDQLLLGAQQSKQNAMNLALNKIGLNNPLGQTTAPTFTSSVDMKASSSEPKLTQLPEPLKTQKTTSSHPPPLKSKESSTLDKKQLTPESSKSSLTEAKNTQKLIEKSQIEQGKAQSQLRNKSQKVPVQTIQGAEAKQPAKQTSLAENEKEKMETIKEKIHHAVVENTAVNNKVVVPTETNKAVTTEADKAAESTETNKAGSTETEKVVSAEPEKVPLSVTPTFKASRSFQLHKDKGNADELRSGPFKKIKVGNPPRVVEENQKSPSTISAEKKDENQENLKEKLLEESMPPVKMASTTKVIRPLVLTSPLAETKQV